jgi:TRAP transporter TAXI family solute receptor
MKKVLFHIVVVLGVLFGQAAQAGTVGVGTMAQGTLSFSTGSVIAKLMNEQLGLEARVQPNTGETVLIPLINQGELDFGIANVLEAADAYQGEGDFAGRAQDKLRIAAVLYPLRVALFVRADSDIHSIADLKGKRVTTGFSAMGTIERVLNSVFANGGLEPSDVKPVPVPNVIKAAEQFVNGRADAFFFAVGAAKVAEVDASVKVRVLPMSDAPDAVERMKAIFPYGYLIQVPPLPNFAGVSEPTYVLGYDNLLLTATHVPADLAKAVAAGLAENKEVLIEGFPLFRSFEPDKIVKPDMPVPYHDGVKAWQASR